MHPIFQNWKVFLLYLAVWVPLGAILGLLISVAGSLSATETAAVIVPVTVVLAFVCLSRGTHAARCRCGRPAPRDCSAQHLLAAMVVAVGVLLVARLAASGFSDILPGSIDASAAPFRCSPQWSR